MRKLMLPLAVCAAFGVSAAPASATSTNVKQNKKINKLNGAMKGVKKAVGILEDINAGQTDSVNKAHAKADATAAGLASLDASVKAIAGAATTALTQLKTGLESLAAAVQGPGIAGQLGAAGTASPDRNASVASLPTGTVYRQIVLGGAAVQGLPLGARLWVKMPDGGPHSNDWVCMSANTSDEAETATNGGAVVTCTTSGP